MTSSRSRILVYGYGNPGRQDDGLGIAFIDVLRGLNIPLCHLEENYQLNAEDALLISNYDRVLFVDASIEDDPFSLTRIKPVQEIGFTTHAMHPSSVAALCKELYSVEPQCWLLALHGYEWKIEEGLSRMASENLEKAVAAIVPLLKRGVLDTLISTMG